MLSHILNNREDLKVAVIVNDMSEVNIDADLVRQDVSLNRAEEKLVEMSNGCICCTLREDLLIEINRLAAEGRFDYLVIESTGISEPLPVAETFTFEDEDGKSLSQIARLDTMVTVVDGVNFLNDYYEAFPLEETGESLGENDERTVADLLIEQVEFCDVLLISKTDLISPERLAELTAVLRKLNSRADIIPMSKGNVPLAKVLNTRRFDFTQAQLAPGWLKELRGEHTPETEEYGISSFVYRARRPFHPERIYDFLPTLKQWPKIYCAQKAIFGWRPGHSTQANGARRTALPNMAPLVYFGAHYPKSNGRMMKKPCTILWKNGRSRLVTCARN